MGYFSRVKKVEVKGKEEKETEAASSKKGGGKKKDKEAGNVSPRAKDTDRDEEGKRKKKKYRLQPHDHQKFVDSNEDVRPPHWLYVRPLVPWVAVPLNKTLYYNTHMLQYGPLVANQEIIKHSFVELQLCTFQYNFICFLQFYVWLFNPPSRSTYFLGILVCEYLQYNHSANSVL